jgi:hypothetical protein
MGRKKKLKWDDPEQSAKFIEFAKQVENEDTRENFEEVIKRIAKAKRREKGIVRTDESRGR